MTGEYLTPAEVAERWKISTRTVHRMAKAGELAHLRVGRAVRISARTVKAWEDSHSRRASTRGADR